MVSRIAAVCVALAVLGASCASPASAAPPRQRLCAGSETPRRTGFDRVTAPDRAFNRSFRHCFATIDGVQLHYVVGGRGPLLVLLHGWPQSWYEWRRELPGLARAHRVVAVDLPGLGDSSGSPPSFDKVTLARYVRGLVVKRFGGSGPVDIAGHDLGAGVAWAYANRYPGEVRRLVVMDFPLPGPACTNEQLRGLSYHFALFQEPGGLAEFLVGGRVRSFLARFYPHVSPKPKPIADAEIDEYARVYRRPSVLHGGFELYRTLPADQRANAAFAARPLTIPVQLISEDRSFAFEAGCYAPGLAAPVQGSDVPGAGHWLNEEAPGEVLGRLRAFFGP